MAGKQNPNPNNTPIDWDHVREKAAAVSRQVLAAVPRILLLFNPTGIVRFLSRMTEVLQVRFTAQVMMWLFSLFFFMVGMVDVAFDGALSGLMCYVIWGAINALTHVCERPRSYRSIYLVMMDMSAAMLMLVVGVTLYLGLASTVVGALIWGVLSAGVLFVILSWQSESGKLKSRA